MRNLFRGDSITDAIRNSSYCGLMDSVHPTAMGHKLISRERIKAFLGEEGE